MATTKKKKVKRHLNPVIVDFIAHALFAIITFFVLYFAFIEYCWTFYNF